MSEPQINPDRTCAIVLAAGDVPASLRPFVGRSCAALLPINGRPIIHWSLQYLREQGFRRVIVGIRGLEARLPRFLQQSFGSQLEIEIVPVNEDRGPGFTLLSCLRRLRPDVGHTSRLIEADAHAGSNFNTMLSTPLPD